jgi:hypothetical protein
MMPWIAGVLLILAGLVVYVIRDARADDRRRKLAKARTYTSGY